MIEGTVVSFVYNFLLLLFAAGRRFYECILLDFVAKAELCGIVESIVFVLFVDRMVTSMDAYYYYATRNCYAYEEESHYEL